MSLSCTLTLPMSQLQTQKLMTSLIRSHIEYLIHTNNILVLILHSKLMRSVAALAIFNTILQLFLIVANFFGPSCSLEGRGGKEITFFETSRSKDTTELTDDFFHACDMVC